MSRKRSLEACGAVGFGPCEVVWGAGFSHAGVRVEGTTYCSVQERQQDAVRPQDTLPVHNTLRAMGERALVRTNDETEGHWYKLGERALELAIFEPKQQDATKDSDSVVSEAVGTSTVSNGH